MHMSLSGRAGISDRELQETIYNQTPSSKATHPNWSQLILNFIACLSIPVTPTDFVLPPYAWSSSSRLKEDQSPALEQEQTQYRRQPARPQFWGKQHEVGVPVIKAHSPVTKREEGKKKKRHLIYHSCLFSIPHCPEMHYLPSLLCWRSISRFIHPVSSWINWKVRREQPKLLRFYVGVACVWIQNRNCLEKCYQLKYWSRCREDRTMIKDNV